MIDRKKTQYVILYVNHNIPSIVQWDPKASVLLWLERRRTALNVVWMEREFNAYKLCRCMYPSNYNSLRDIGRIGNTPTHRVSDSLVFLAGSEYLWELVSVGLNSFERAYTLLVECRP